MYAQYFPCYKGTLISEPFGIYRTILKEISGCIEPVIRVGKKIKIDHMVLLSNKISKAKTDMHII